MRVRIKENKSHGRAGKIYKQGDALNVSEGECEAFGDKFEVVKTVKVEQQPQDDLFSLTVKQLKEKADSEGVEYSPTIKKADLVELLNGNK